jgi:hypothetical protein
MRDTEFEACYGKQYESRNAQVKPTATSVRYQRTPRSLLSASRRSAARTKSAPTRASGWPVALAEANDEMQAEESVPIAAGGILRYWPVHPAHPGAY